MDRIVLTRGTKELIQKAIEETTVEDRNNRYKICEKVAQIVEDRFPGDNLDYQLGRMGISTTGQILDKIDIYFYKYLRSN